MPSIIPNAFLESCLRNCLATEGYRLSPPRKHGEAGVDIKASRDGQTWHIECIGYKSSGSARAKDFYEAFFRVVSRLNDGAEYLAIALAEQARAGLPARAKQHRLAWKRLAHTFPELQIWFVDTKMGSYTRHPWAEWAKEEEMSKDFDALWSRVQSCAGQTFLTKTGKICRYEARDSYVILENTQHNIPKAHFAKALELMPASKVTDLRDLRGYAYLWGIMMDDRIRAGLY